LLSTRTAVNARRVRVDSHFENKGAGVATQTTSELIHALDQAPRPTTDASIKSAPRNRRTVLAHAVVRELSKTIVDPTQLTLKLDDHVDSGRPVSAARARINGAAALARLLWPPTPDTFAEGYLRGDLEIDGDVSAAIDAAQNLDFRRLGATAARRLLRYGLELRGGEPDRAPLARGARLVGRRHSRARDMAAIRFHYDVGEAFFALWLDRRLTYSCAWFDSAADPAADLDAAQEAKLDLICRKLDLHAGERLLDIGCGWGSLILFAAQRYGVEALGVTLSERQAAEANRCAAADGLSGRVRAEVRDYRDLDGLGLFDAVASVGMFEHVGIANMRSYFEAAWRSLRPGGRFLNHGIARGRRRVGFGPLRRGRGSHFVERYVFPDGELVPVEQAIAIARGTVGFELLDVQLLRPHYALTLRAWIQRLERSWDAAVRSAGPEVARTWRLYMSGARLGFERGELDVAQLLLARPLDAAVPAPRPLRPWW
jgi:cyclopropane-fatty-acyl-phospholipid synthase